MRIALTVSLLIVGAGIALALSERGARMAGTSFVAQRHFAVALPPGTSACQPGTYLADDAAAVSALVGTYGRPRPALAVTFSEPNGSVVARGRLGAGRREGDVVLPLNRVVEGSRSVTACMRNEGSARVVLAGDVANADNAARVDGEPVGGVMGFRYLREGRESWWQLAPVVAQRFGLGKAEVFGTWTLPLLALAIVALWVAAIRLLLRETSA